MAAISGGTAIALTSGAAGLGALASNSGRDKQKNLSSTASYDPWQSKWLSPAFDRAKTLSETPREYFPNQTYASPTEATLLGLQRQQDRATNGSELFNTARDQNLATIRGDFLNANPYLDSAIDNANRGTVRAFNNSVIPQLQSQFALSGRYGSGSQQNQQQSASQDLLNQLGSNASNISYANYGDERSRMASAIANAPAYAQADYNDIASLLDVGQQREAITQQGIDEAMNRFNFAQDEPRNRLAEYLGLIGGNFGGTTTTTERNPNYKSTSSALLGGALGGAGLGLSLLGSQNQYSRGAY